MNPDQIDTATAIATACSKLSGVYLDGLDGLLIAAALGIFLSGLILGWTLRGHQ
jgi:hypothetical protein